MSKHTFLKLLVAFLITQFCVAQKFQDTIPFRDDLGLIIIPISFNGKVKEFAFDTGAQRTLAYEWPSEELKATRKQTTIVSSSGRRTRMKYYKSGTITLGSRKITGHRILNTPANEIFTCYKVDGILGVDIIKKLNWKIDYKNKYLIMYPANFMPPELNEMHALAFDFNSNRPYVYLQRKSSRFQFLLDTGAGGYSNISKKNYNLVGIEDLPQEEVYTGSYDVSGVFTSSAPKVIQFPESISKKVTLSPIIFYNNMKSTKLGNKLWKDKTLFVSLENEMLYVSDSTLKNEYQTYPCFLSLQDDKMVVLKINKNSEAWEQGLRQGTVVEKINGKRFNDFCELTQYQRHLMSMREPIEILLTNGKRIVLNQINYFK